jgi:DNA gyrase subunit A
LPVTTCANFQSRTSTGVRGMTLKGDDEVISLSILHRVGTTSEEREEYVRFAPWKGEKEAEPSLSPERMAELAEREQFILTVCANGYGKLSSAYEYRRTGRGGQGITNIDNIGRNGPGRGQLPGRSGRPADAGDRSGQADPTAARKPAGYRPRQRRGAAVQRL